MKQTRFIVLAAWGIAGLIPAARLCAQDLSVNSGAYGSPVTDPPVADNRNDARSANALHSQGYVNRFATFPGVRAEILNTIGAAHDRLWIVTNYLTDGDIVTALFLAKYRKLDVRVILDRHNMNSYMSRLDYLKRQNIPAFVKPERFPIKAPTAIVADDAAYQLDASLDFMSASNNFTLLGATPNEVNQWAAAMRAATEPGMPAIPRPMMQAGKQNTGRTYFRPYSPGKSPASEPVDSSYNYNRNRARQRGVPEGISRQLPKTPIYQERQKKAAERAAEKAAAQQAEAEANAAKTDMSPEPSLANPPGGANVPEKPQANPLSPSPEEP